jgi:DNA polymerase V
MQTSRIGLAEDYLESQLDLKEYPVRNKTATFLMRVEGDSMRGAGIFHGDLIVVDRAAEPKGLPLAQPLPGG